jgi:hypothetical protein
VVHLGKRRPELDRHFLVPISMLERVRVAICCGDARLR